MNLRDEYQKILERILSKIRASVDLSTLCTTSCQDVCRLLKIERVVIYRFNDDWSGSYVNNLGFAEAPWDALKTFGEGLVWKDSHLQETQGGRYKNNEPFAVADIYSVGHSRCHIEVLEQFQIRAYAVAPIFVGEKLWGLMGAYQHSAPRKWHSHEVGFVAQAASHIGLAIQRTQEQEKNKQDSMARQRALMEVVGNIRSSLDTDFILDTACEEICKLFKIERAGVYRFNEDWSGEFVSHFGTVLADWGEVGIKPFGKNLVWEDTHLQETKGGRYRNNESFAVADVYEAGHSRCHLDILQQFKIRAYALTPIFIGRNLWGLLAAYQHSAPRDWDDVEVEFLEQVANQVGLAIQSSETLSETRSRADDLQQAAEQRRILFDVVVKIRESLDLETIF